MRPGHWAACHLVTDDDYPHIRAGENDAAQVDEAAGGPAAEGDETA